MFSRTFYPPSSPQPQNKPIQTASPWFYSLVNLLSINNTSSHSVQPGTWWRKELWNGPAGVALGTTGQPLFPLGSCDGRFVLAGDGDAALGDIALLAGSADGQHPVQRQRRRDGQRVHIVGDAIFPAELPGDEAVLVLLEKMREAGVDWG